MNKKWKMAAAASQVWHDTSQKKWAKAEISRVIKGVTAAKQTRIKGSIVYYPLRLFTQRAEWEREGQRSAQLAFPPSSYSDSARTCIGKFHGSIVYHISIKPHRANLCSIPFDSKGEKTSLLTGSSALSVSRVHLFVFQACDCSR